jgi:hypothetical protein
MRTTLRRGALLVATALLAIVGVQGAQAQVAYTANTITSLYYREFKKDDRYYVFNDAAAASRFEQSGETGVGITKIGVGPNGETVFADNETAMELFFFKHGISEKVDRPKTPPLALAWRDGKTRITIGSNFYLEMSSRIQIRYTHEFPTTRSSWGTENAATAGQLPIRRAQFKLGAGCSARARVRGPAQLARRSTAQPNRFLRTPTSIGTSPRRRPSASASASSRPPTAASRSPPRARSSS